MSEQFTFDFSPSLTEMLATGATVGRSGKRRHGIDSFSTRNNLIVLRNFIMSEAPRRTLEVGLAYGGSCLVFCASHKDLGRTPSKQHIAIDPYQQSVWDDVGNISIERDSLSGFLDFRSQRSSVVLPQLWRDGDQFDLIYIDGSHLFEDTFVDAYFAIRLLSEKGVVLFDDCADRHVAKVIRFLHSSLGDRLKEVGLLHYRARAASADIRYRLGGLLGRRQLRGFRLIGTPERPWNAPFIQF
jgi:hypothetical protein